jgi:DNA-binding MarR family transcriptional regulator
MDGPRYEPQVGALLRMAWESLQVELYANLRAAGFDDLRDAHRPALRHPPIDGMRPTDLARHLGLSKQAANDLIRDLEQCGYIRLERDPSDGRARIIRYTERGWRLFDTGSRLSREVGARWANAIGQEQYDQFLSTLRTIVDLDRS